MSFTILLQDSFVSTGVGVRIPIPSSANYFRTINKTQLPLTATPGVVIRAEWTPEFNPNDGIRWKKQNGTSVITIDTFATSTASDGFTYVTTTPVVEPQAANAITAITAASPAVVTQTNTYSEGDIVRIYSTTGMLQIAGMDFQISTVSGSGYTLTGLRAAGFATPGTAGFTRRISKYSAVDPQFLYITEITQATQAVVRTSVDPTPYYVVGMKIYFSIPASFGMTQMNGLTGTITAVSAANYTVTVDIDSTAFTAFAFPASTSSPTAQLFATYSPAGQSTRYDPILNVQTGYNFLQAPFHTGQFTPFMYLAGGAQSPAGASGDTIIWQAIKKEN